MNKKPNYILFFILMSCSANDGTIADNYIDSASIHVETNHSPVISNLIVEQNSEEGIILATFDLMDEEEDSLEVRAWLISGDKKIEISNNHLSGDFGFPVVDGLNKSISWKFFEDPIYSHFQGNEIQLQIEADDRYANNLEEIIELVEIDRIENDIRNLEGIRNSSRDPAKLEQSRTYLRSNFEAYGIKPIDQNFNYAGTTGINIIGTINGTKYSDKYYLIVGHYDTIASSPGADDNASGTAGMLEAMRVLSQFNFETGIKFIGFDLEEIGLRGSRFYASTKDREEQIEGMLNFEMIGYICTGEPECNSLPNADTSIYVIGSSFAEELSNDFLEIGNSFVPGLKVVNIQDDGNPNFRRSDHAPFWDIGVDALFITDGANFRNPHYHQASDLLETLELEFATNIVKVSVGTIAKLAEFTHSTVQTTETFTLN